MSYFSPMYLRKGYISPSLLADLMCPALTIGDLFECVKDSQEVEHTDKHSMYSYFIKYHLKKIENLWTNKERTLYGFDKWFMEEWGIPFSSAYIISKYSCKRWKKANYSEFAFDTILKRHNNVSSFSEYLERQKILHIGAHFIDLRNMDRSQAKWIIKILEKYAYPR